MNQRLHDTMNMCRRQVRRRWTPPIGNGVKPPGGAWPGRKRRCCRRSCARGSTSCGRTPTWSGSGTPRRCWRSIPRWDAAGRTWRACDSCFTLDFPASADTGAAANLFLRWDRGTNRRRQNLALTGPLAAGAAASETYPRRIVRKKARKAGVAGCHRISAAALP